MSADDADHGAVARGNRHAQERLEPFLLELRDVGHARVCEQVVGDERGLVALCRPPGETASPFQRDLADQVPVRISRGPQHQAVALDEIDEAGVNSARVGEQAHDSAQHLVDLERRGDGGDDPRQNVVAACRVRFSRLAS